MAQIDDYLAGLDADSAGIIEDAYGVARGVVPDATEAISYGMPALIHAGSPLLSLMRAKGHIGIYPFSPAVIAAVLADHAPIPGMTSAKGTIRLPADAPVPKSLIIALAAARRDEIDAAVAARGASKPRKATPGG